MTPEYRLMSVSTLLDMIPYNEQLVVTNLGFTQTYPQSIPMFLDMPWSSPHCHERPHTSKVLQVYIPGLRANQTGKSCFVVEKVPSWSYWDAKKVDLNNVIVAQLQRNVNAMWTPNERNVNAMCTERKIYTPLFYTPPWLFTLHFCGFTLQHDHLHSSTCSIFQNLKICQIELKKHIFQ